MASASDENVDTADTKSQIASEDPNPDHVLNPDLVHFAVSLFNYCQLVETPIVLDAGLLARKTGKTHAAITKEIERIRTQVPHLNVWSTVDESTLDHIKAAAGKFVGKRKQKLEKVGKGKAKKVDSKDKIVKPEKKTPEKKTPEKKTPEKKTPDKKVRFLDPSKVMDSDVDDNVEGETESDFAGEDEE